MPFVDLAAGRVELRQVAGTAGRPALVFLHHGLGSIGQWRDFPDRLCATVSCPGVVYARPGYGRSDPTTFPRPVDYMHRQALEVLPELLARLGIARPILVGHSDGASIALVHAARHPVRALALMAPHVFVEEISVAGVVEAERAFREGELRAALARHHRDPDATFAGWSEVWRSERFRSWTLEPVLADVAVPTLLIQGEDDEYGTRAQLDTIRRHARGPVALHLLSGCGHEPYRERAAETLSLMTEFLAPLVG